MRLLLKLLLILISIVAIAACVTVAVLFYQSKQLPQQGAPYVALGSSFAAGLGLGPRLPDTPLVCQRSNSGYPRQLSRLLDLPLVDMSCSGATIHQVLNGGQFFLGSQLTALGPDTQLVTITAGGNDINYVGDLTMMAYAKRDSVAGWWTNRIWSGPKSESERDYSQLRNDMKATLAAIKQRAPNATIAVALYPLILPGEGSCDQLGIDAEEAALIRPVGAELANITREAALAANAIIIDMDALGVGHDVCSEEPWMNGIAPATGSPFHPNLAGAVATAQAIAAALADQKNK